MRTTLGDTAPTRAPASGIGHAATIDADRRRASGGNVQALERRFDGPIPAADRAQAEQQDAAAAAARASDPTLALSLRIAAVEEERNITLARLRELDGWLAERTSVPDQEYVAREHSCGCSHGLMGGMREEAEELRQRAVAELRLVARLCGDLAAIVERKVAA